MTGLVKDMFSNRQIMFPKPSALQCPALAGMLSSQHGWDAVIGMLCGGLNEGSMNGEAGVLLKSENILFYLPCSRLMNNFLNIHVSMSIVESDFVCWALSLLLEAVMWCGCLVMVVFEHGQARILGKSSVIKYEQSRKVAGTAAACYPCGRAVEEQWGAALDIRCCS